MIFKDLAHANALEEKQNLDIVTALGNLKTLTKEIKFYTAGYETMFTISKATVLLKDLNTIHGELDRNELIDVSDQVVDIKNDIIHNVERLIHAFYMRTEERNYYEYVELTIKAAAFELNHPTDVTAFISKAEAVLLELYKIHFAYTWFLSPTSKEDKIAVGNKVNKVICGFYDQTIYLIKNNFK